jgi:hypothetical protein
MSEEDLEAYKDSVEFRTVFKIVMKERQKSNNNKDQKNNENNSI